MDLKITGIVKKLLEEQSGESQKGPWRKQEFILETEGNYPKQICIVQWGDNIDKFGIKEDDPVTVHVDIQSREYNGRWYTDVKAWKVVRADAGGHAPPSPSNEPWPEPPASSDDDDDDGLLGPQAEGARHQERHAGRGQRAHRQRDHRGGERTAGL